MKKFKLLGVVLILSLVLGGCSSSSSSESKEG